MTMRFCFAGAMVALMVAGCLGQPPDAEAISEGPGSREPAVWLTYTNGCGRCGLTAKLDTLLVPFEGPPIWFSFEARGWNGSGIFDAPIHWDQTTSTDVEPLVNEALAMLAGAEPVINETGAINVTAWHRHAWTVGEDSAFRWALATPASQVEAEEFLLTGHDCTQPLIQIQRPSGRLDQWIPHPSGQCSDRPPEGDWRLIRGELVDLRARLMAS
ncbi:MAG: hypothetical protein ACPGQL_06335 [Thermoplasmatota archaeon]